MNTTVAAMNITQFGASTNSHVSDSRIISSPNAPLTPQFVPNNQLRQQHPPQTMSRPVVPLNRTIFDKVLDYMIGEGPNNRFSYFFRGRYIFTMFDNQN